LRYKALVGVTGCYISLVCTSWYTETGMKMNMNVCWVTVLASLLLQATYCDGKLLARFETLIVCQ